MAICQCSMRGKQTAGEEGAKERGVRRFCRSRRRRDKQDSGNDNQAEKIDRELRVVAAFDQPRGQRAVL